MGGLEKATPKGGLVERKWKRHWPTCAPIGRPHTHAQRRCRCSCDARGARRPTHARDPYPVRRDCATGLRITRSSEIHLY
eukprot:6047284-Prymnesium_polylepis.1